jgi:hypothetical protein
MADLGLMDDEIDALPSPAARVAGNVTVSGARGGVDCNPLLLEEQGALLHGRLTRLSGHHASFANDLEQTIANGLQFEQQVRTRIDDYARANRIDVAPPPPPLRPGNRAQHLKTKSISIARGSRLSCWRMAFAQHSAGSSYQSSTSSDSLEQRVA